MSFAQERDKEFIEKLTRITEANLSNDQFGVSELAREIGMSRSNLHRRMKDVAGISISQFIRKVRLERAMEQLRGTSSTITEVAFECGFSSVSYFTKCFHEHFGYPPGRVRTDDIELSGPENPKSETVQISRPEKQKIIIGVISGILVLITAGVLMIIVKPFGARDKSPEKSIAVLPFINDSPDKENEYFINGTMEAILENLCKIENLRVPGRTSVEQYRNAPKPIPVIAGELKVRYILEGSGQKDGNRILLTVQLRDAKKDKNLWSNTYNRETDDKFALQVEIAEIIAEEIQAIITPSEKELIEKIPTSSLTALNFYSLGREEHWKYDLYGDSEALDRAVRFYKEALKNDSTFAEAYVGLGRAFFVRNIWKSYLSENYLDSVLILADKAIAYDPGISEAYGLRGVYFTRNGEEQKAIEDFEQAIRYNPNNWKAYFNLGQLYQNHDLVKSLEAFQKAIARERGPQLPLLLSGMGRIYWCAGYQDKCLTYMKQKLILDGDSLSYKSNQIALMYFNGQYREVIEFLENEYTANPGNTSTLFWLAASFSRSGEFEESVGFFKKWYDLVKAYGGGEASDWGLSRMGYAFWQYGNKEKAMEYFNEQIDLSQRLHELGRSQDSYFDLAGVYAFTGQRQKAYENLRIFNRRKVIPIYLEVTLKDEPLFDNLRDEPEFQQIVREVEAKYLAEHERVGKWMEKHDPF